MVRIQGLFIPICPSFVITGVCGGIRACRETQRRCGDPWKNQDVVFVFHLCTCLYR